MPGIIEAQHLMAVRLRPLGHGKHFGACHVGEEARQPEQPRFVGIAIAPAIGDAPASDFLELRFPLVHLMNLWSFACSSEPRLMVTILQVVPRLDAGGSELATLEIAQALQHAGAKALVATEGGRLAEDIEKAGGEIVTLPMASKNPLTILANARRLFRLVEERGVDLLHARSRAPAWSALLAARRSLRPFVTTYHGAYGEAGPFKRAYNSVMRRGERIIANSRFTASRDRGARSRARATASASSIAASMQHASIRPPCHPARPRGCGRNGASLLVPRSCCTPRVSPASRASAT